MSNPVERKVYASTLGSGVGVTVTSFALWVADTVWWPSDTEEVPVPVAGFVGLVVTAGLTFIFGWLAKHGIEEPQEENQEVDHTEFEHEQRLA
jgi:hypothetical protein